MSDLTRRSFLARSLSCTAGLSGIAALGMGAGCGGGGGTPPARSRNKDMSLADLQTLQDAALKFMAANNVPGLSIAIAHNDNFAYAEGFGAADLDTGQPVTPGSLFRIASVTKPITATIVRKLIELGKLKPTGKVFGTGALLGNRYAPYDAATSSWVQQIMVEHLLTHTAGGWFEDNPLGSGFTDPMFQNLNIIDMQLFVSTTMRAFPLQYAPGTFYGYSNFGYCLLGRIIEKVAGMPYERAAYQYALQPSDITDMHIGTSTPRPNEVSYYLNATDLSNWTAQTLPITRLDSVGGWVASATDLVQFLMRVDKLPTVPDILQPTTIDAMTTATALSLVGLPPGSGGYSEGWSVYPAVNTTQWWHTGSLPGTTTIMERTDDNFCWAALTNTRNLPTATNTLNPPTWMVDDLVTLVRKDMIPNVTWP